MNFNYGNKTPTPYWGTDIARYRYSLYSTEKKPRIEVLPEPTHETQPFADRKSLVARMMESPAEETTDPFALSSQRARIQSKQMELLLEQLAARHGINYQICRDIEYEECILRAQLDEIRSRENRIGREGRFEGDLIKQLQQLRKEYHAESVACWRDTGRILSDICDRWTDYADQSRRARLMDLDL